MHLEVILIAKPAYLDYEQRVFIARYRISSAPLLSTVRLSGATYTEGSSFSSSFYPWLNIIFVIIILSRTTW